MVRHFKYLCHFSSITLSPSFISCTIGINIGIPCHINSTYTTFKNRLYILFGLAEDQNVSWKCKISVSRKLLIEDLIWVWRKKCKDCQAFYRFFATCLILCHLGNISIQRTADRGSYMSLGGGGGECEACEAFYPFFATYLINSLPPWEIFPTFCRLLVFFMINFLEKLFQEYYQSVK